MDLSETSNNHSPNQQATTLHPLEIPDFDNDTASISSSIQLSFEDISPILPTTASAFPFRRDLFKRHQSEQRIIPSTSNTMFPAATTTTSLGTEALLRHSASERLLKRCDSGVFVDADLDAPSGLHNAKVSARAMNRAMRHGEKRRPDPTQPKYQVPERRHTHAQRSNASRPRRNQDLASLPPTRLYQDESTTTRSRCMLRIPLFRRSTRTTDRMANEFRNIEANDEISQQRLLADHMDKIFGAVPPPPPLSEGPRRDVEFVVTESGRKGTGFAVRFGEAEAEDEIAGLAEGGGLWERLKGRVKGWRKRRGA